MAIEQLAAALADGSVRVVDLTQPLSESTPVLQLPPPLANTPGLSREDISRFDDAGPAWAWTTLTVGEHVGTHFDAPVHWITGRDGEDVASVAPSKLVAPAAVIDKSAECRRGPELPAHAGGHPGLGERARPAPAGRLAAVAHRLGRPRARPGGVPQRRPDARPGRRGRALAGRDVGDRRRRRGDRRHRRRRRAFLRAAVPGPPLPARRGQVRPDAAREPGRAAAAGRDRRRRAAEARRRDGLAVPRLRARLALGSPARIGGREPGWAASPSTAAETWGRGGWGCDAWAIFPAR